MNAGNTTKYLIEKIKCALDVVTNVVSHKVRALPNELWLGIFSKLQRSSVIVHVVDNIPLTEFFTGIPRNTQSKPYMVALAVSGISKIMHYGIFINMPYCNETISNPE